jgi:hypothetical protein
MCPKLLLSIMRGMTHVHKWLCEHVSVLVNVDAHVPEASAKHNARHDTCA